MKNAKEITELTPKQCAQAEALREKMQLVQCPNMQKLLRQLEVTATSSEMKTLAQAVRTGG